MCGSDDEIQQQPPPKPRKTNYEDLKVVEPKKLCKERGLRKLLIQRLLNDYCM